MILDKFGEDCYRICSCSYFVFRLRETNGANFTWKVVNRMQVSVRDNNVEQAMRALKKKLQREGVFREMKLKDFFEKPSLRKAREKAEAIRRTRKLARKKAQREGGL